MNELLAKISSYNIFNYLVPGALFCVLIDAAGIARATSGNIATDLVLYYVAGMSLSRVGSFSVGRLTRRFRIRPKNSYGQFITATKHDTKIEVLQETANTYRTIAAAFLVLLLLKLLVLCGVARAIGRDATTVLLFAAAAILFVTAYVRQVRYVDRRVHHHSNLAPTDTEAP